MREEAAQKEYLYRMKADGSDRRQLIPDTIRFLVNISPDEHWAVMWDAAVGVQFFPVGSGNPRPLCLCAAGPIFQDSPRVAWSGDGKFLFLSAGTLSGTVGGTMIIPWKGIDTFPRKGLTAEAVQHMTGSRNTPELSVAPGPDNSHYAFVRTAEQSNLYRIPLQ
jgi:hypothetical protein